MFSALQARRQDPNKKLKHALNKYPISKNLAVEKFRLYEVLVMYVKELNTARGKMTMQRKKLEEAEVLFDMGLRVEAAEVAEKGIEKAVEMEDLHLEVLLRDLLRRVLKSMNQSKLVNKRTENEYLLVMASKKLATLMRYNQINDRMFDYMRSYRVTDSDAVKRGIEELVNLPEMKDVNMADSLPSQTRYHTSWEHYYGQLNDFEKSNEHSRWLLKLWEKKPERIQADPSEYRTAMTNLIGKLSMLGHTEEAAQLLSKLQKLSVKGRKEETSHFVGVEIQYQLFYLNQGQLQKALERESIILEGLKKFQKSISNSNRLTLIYNLGINYLLLDKDKKAIHYFDRIRQLGSLPERQDLQGVARLLRLLLMSNKRSELNFEHYLRNSQRFFSKNHRGYDLEILVHDWLLRHEKVSINNVSRSLAEFVELLKPFVDGNTLGAEEMWLWAKARAEGKSTEQVFLEHLGKA